MRLPSRRQLLLLDGADQQYLARLTARLVNGSDYPLPAINALMQTSAMVRAGFLTGDERALLNEVDQHDPLLFDFVTKRTVHLGAARLADEVFQVRPEVFPRLAEASLQNH